MKRKKLTKAVPSIIGMTYIIVTQSADIFSATLSSDNEFLKQDNTTYNLTENDRVYTYI